MEILKNVIFMALKIMISFLITPSYKKKIMEWKERGGDG